MTSKDEPGLPAITALSTFVAWRVTGASIEVTWRFRLLGPTAVRPLRVIHPEVASWLATQSSPSPASAENDWLENQGLPVARVRVSEPTRGRSPGEAQEVGCGLQSLGGGSTASRKVNA